MLSTSRLVSPAFRRRGPLKGRGSTTGERAARAEGRLSTPERAWASASLPAGGESSMTTLLVVFDELLIVARKAQRWHVEEALSGEPLTCAAADPHHPGRVYRGTGEGRWQR